MNDKEQDRLDIAYEIDRLRDMSVNQLQDEYLRRFGAESRSRNKDYLWKRLAYRIQEMREGGLSENARNRIALLAPGTALRARDPIPLSKKAMFKGKTPVRDPRLPRVGTVLRREYEGEMHTVTVLAEGFQYRGDSYSSLSSIAKTITGTSWNGYRWFGLQKRDTKKANGK